MESRLAANPLDVSRALAHAPGDGVVEEIAGQFAAARGIKGVDSGDAEYAAEIAAGEIEFMGGNQVQFLAVLDAMAEEAGRVAGLAGAALAGRSVDAATMFAEEAVLVMATGGGKARGFDARSAHIPLREGFRDHHPQKSTWNYFNNTAERAQTFSLHYLGDFIVVRGDDRGPGEDVVPSIPSSRQGGTHPTHWIFPEGDLGSGHDELLICKNMNTAVRIICFTLLLLAVPVCAAAEDFANAVHAYLQQWDGYAMQVWQGGGLRRDDDL